ncbi:hypothetical protein LOY55_24030 [Pseudomonas sp. B21-040]|uniref:hypothetical protein n=1 Tax=Pseudomonas sp. B21-040 TaxID=2895486 RepID=UPI0021604FE1|nr:hypothetical protein [Pseudomonas sp. B21-040]UVL39272.1 hypothetical protein LOY55_24030 [Pseudomonas sp. B21-040]
MKFSGTGHIGATVEISIVSGPNGTAPPAVVVTADKWETTATNWPFGTYSLRAIQKVPDNAGGWIESLPYTFTFSRVLPDLSDVTYTAVYQPTFSGKGYNGATVKLYDPGGSSMVAPDALVTDGRWSSRASQVWGPTGRREVHIRQTLNGQTSAWVTLVVTIAPLAPDVNDPVEDGLSPRFSGKCWPGAVVSLTFSGSSTVHTATVVGDNWTFQRGTPFTTGVTHTVTVTQTAAQQTSPSVAKTFTVKLPMVKPQITAPQENAEVGRDLTVQGLAGMKGASMQLRDAQFGRNLGAPKVLAADGEWSIDLTALEFREYAVDAQQTLNQQESVHSDVRVFNVVLTPPIITVPIENGDLPRTSTIEGWAMPGAQVSVWLDGVAEPLLTNIPVQADGRWKADVTLPVGKKAIRARQTQGNQTSRDSRPLPYNVVPAAPYIESPASDEHIGRRGVISGFGVPGDTVTVSLNGAATTVLGRNPVLEDRTWSVTMEFDQPGGLCALTAVASCDGFDSVDSPKRQVRLGTYLPSIELPAAGQWVSHPVGFKGKGRPGVGQVASWFNPDQVWAPNLPVGSGGWQGGAGQSLPVGGQWCRFKQTITDGTDGATVSDWADSQRFQIELAPPTEP